MSTPPQAGSSQPSAVTVPDGSILAQLNAIIKPGSNFGQLSQTDIIQLLMQNTPKLLEFAKEGKLNEAQIQQLRILSNYTRQQAAQAAQGRQQQPQAQAQQAIQALAAAQAKNMPQQSTTAAQAASPHHPQQQMNPSQLHAQQQTQQHVQPPPPQNPQQAQAQAQQLNATKPPAAPSKPNPLKRKSMGDDPPITASSNQMHNINTTLSSTNPGPQAWPNTASQGRPTLTAGLPAGRLSGTPAQLERVPEDLSMYGLGDGRVGPRKMTPADQSMRRSIQDLVSSIDPNVRIEPDVEDLLLDIADEFIDSVTNFGCRLAKHRGGDTLEVRDLQLHLERNHNIRIPGFASDETRFSQSGVAGGAGASGGAATSKKGTQGTHMTLRSSRLAAVQQAKKDAKLI